MGYIQFKQLYTLITTHNDKSLRLAQQILENAKNRQDYFIDKNNKNTLEILRTKYSWYQDRINFACNTSNNILCLLFLEIFITKKIICANMRKQLQKTMLLLFDYGMNINTPGIYGRTILHWAVLSDDKEIVKWLCEHHAYIDIQDERGHTVLHRAVDSGSIAMVNVLLHQQACVNIVNNVNVPPLQMAVCSNSPEIVTSLINHRANVNFQDHYGLSLLMHAVFRENIPLTKKLLASNANANLLNKEHQTPLIYASRAGNVALISILASATQDINFIDINGASALYWAVARGNYHTAQCLLNHGANINIMANKLSLLDIVCKLSYHNLFDLLIQHKIEVKINQETLQYLARTKQINIICELWLHGIRAENNNIFWQNLLSVNYFVNANEWVFTPKTQTCIEYFHINNPQQKKYLGYWPINKAPYNDELLHFADLYLRNIFMQKYAKTYINYLQQWHLKITCKKIYNIIDPKNPKFTLHNTEQNSKANILKLDDYLLRHVLTFSFNHKKPLYPGEQQLFSLLLKNPHEQMSLQCNI